MTRMRCARPMPFLRTRTSLDLIPAAGIVPSCSKRLTTDSGCAYFALNGNNHLNRTCTCVRANPIFRHCDLHCPAKDSGTDRYRDTPVIISHVHYSISSSHRVDLPCQCPLTVVNEVRINRTLCRVHTSYAQTYRSTKTKRPPRKDGLHCVQDGARQVHRRETPLSTVQTFETQLSLRL